MATLQILIKVRFSFFLSTHTKKARKAHLCKKTFLALDLLLLITSDNQTNKVRGIFPVNWTVICTKVKTY